MAAIYSLTSRGGVNPWAEVVVEWTGDINYEVGQTYTLYWLPSGTFLTGGNVTSYHRNILPESTWRFQLLVPGGITRETTYVAPPLPPPSSITADTSAGLTLTWAPVVSATSYEIADVLNGNLIVGTVTSPTWSTTLEPFSSFSYSVRSRLGALQSTWSTPIVFNSAAGGLADPGVYEFSPFASATYFPSLGWLPYGAALEHGNGAYLGRPNEPALSLFFFTSDQLTSMGELANNDVVSCKVYLRRFSDGSDARAVLSHWVLHKTTPPQFLNPPEVPPDELQPSVPPPVPGPLVLYGDGIDSGQLMLGESDWFDLPINWAKTLTNYFLPGGGTGPAFGIGWGGVQGRYMNAAHVDDPASPKNGTLQIVVA